jgi:hypothetical protein
MRSLIIGIATLAMATVAATPAISASYESGYLGQAMAATGLIQRDEMPTCRATTFRRARTPWRYSRAAPATFQAKCASIGEGREAWFCLN